MCGYKISQIEEFQSRFLSGSEIGSRIVPLTITEVKKEQVPSNPMNPASKQIDCYVVYFKGKERGVKLGKERAHELQALLGDDTDKWVNKEVHAYTASKSIKGKIMPVIHFKGKGVTPDVEEEGMVDINDIVI